MCKMLMRPRQKESKTRPTTINASNDYDYDRTHNSQPTSHLESIEYRVDGQPHWAAATATRASPPLPRLTDAIRAQARGLVPFWAATDALDRLPVIHPHHHFLLLQLRRRCRIVVSSLSLARSECVAHSRARVCVAFCRQSLAVSSFFLS